MGKEDISAYLGRWQQAQAARLKHLQFQVTAKQLDVIEEALSRVMQLAIKTLSESPNRRGNALHILCKSFLERKSCDGA